MLSLWLSQCYVFAIEMVWHNKWQHADQSSSVNIAIMMGSLLSGNIIMLNILNQKIYQYFFPVARDMWSHGSHLSIIVIVHLSYQIYKLLH